MTNTALAKKLADLTDNNEHTRALIVKAEAMHNELGDAFATILREIEDEHELAGHLPEDCLALRNAIGQKLKGYNEYLGLANGAAA